MGGHVIRSYGYCRPKLSNGPIQVSCFEQFSSGAGVERSRLNAVGLFKEFLRTLAFSLGFGCLPLLTQDRGEIGVRAYQV